MSISTVVTRGFGTWGNIGFIITRGYSLGAPAPIVVGTPTGAGGEEERRKWLEWREKRHRQRRRLVTRGLLPRSEPAERVLPGKAAPPVRAPILPLQSDVVGTAALLAANMKASREQRDALEASAAWQKALDDDDEEALILLLEAL